jgi:ubiquinol-cytochrome c reductase cytochrome b subunit
MGIVPYVGTQLQQLVVGGSDYGHHTLTRFFALHAGVLPALLVFFLVLHVAIFRRHGIHAKDPVAGQMTTFWPDQVLKDAVACLAVMCAVLFFVFRPVIFGAAVGDHPGSLLGAELDAPSDPSNAYSAARPEWYFLFLFQFLKYFPGESEIYGAIVIPGLLMGVLFMMPIVGRWRLGHWFNIGYVACVLLGAGYLTAQAWYDDNITGLDYRLGVASDAGKMESSKAYLQAVHDAKRNAERAIELASAPSGIPPTGAISLMRNDPMTAGPRLFASYCASCHNHVDSAGEGIKAKEASAPNLFGFASRAWLKGLLDPAQVAGPNYFGLTAHKASDMVEFVRGDLKQKSADDLAKLIVGLSAEARLPLQAADDKRDAAIIAAAGPLYEKLGCADCHRVAGQGDLGSAPDLTGYGSDAWLTAFISSPGHQRFYGEHNDRMPAFADSDDPARNRLRPEELRLIVRWLRGDWYRAAGE